jgi:hypothetical protein
MTAATITDVRPRVLEVIRAEFHEMPGMRLTPSQFRRLWQLDPDECEAVIGRLRAEGFLEQDSHGQLHCALDVCV